MNATIVSNGDGTYTLTVADAKGYALHKFNIPRAEVQRLMMQASVALYRKDEPLRDEAEREYEYFAHRRQA